MPDSKPAFRLKYNGVVVIQSLPDDEEQTGRQLYDDIISRRCQQTTKASYFYDPVSKKDFLGVLDRICALVVHDELFPIIHFEIHGNPNGLVLKSGEGINWEQIQNHCRLINVQLKNQLIITLATCWGSHIWKMIDIAKPAPYWGYIGPKQSIEVGTLMEDFGTFYDTLIAGESLDEALNTIKVNGNRDQYIYLHCKGIFEYHIEQKLAEIPLDKKSTFKRLALKTKDQLPNFNRYERRKYLRNSIDKLDRIAFIANLKKTFLMT